MSALESIINQRFKEFESARPSRLAELRRELEELVSRSDALPPGSPAAPPLHLAISTVRRRISEASQPSQEELDYIMQVGYLLHTMENEEEEQLAKPDKLFYGCSVRIEKQKGRAYKRYMAEVEQDQEYQEKMMHEAFAEARPVTCKFCGGELMSAHGCTFCKDCAVESNEPLIDLADVKNTITYEQQVNDVVTVYSYNRLNHLNEWLSKLQAREMTNIPSDVVDALRLELKKARVTNPADITQKKVKELLKKLKLSKYYEHVPNITNILTGAEVPSFPPHLEDKIRTMFEQVQEPFRMFCPKTRKNFLHYGYVLYKFCELLGEDRWLPFIPMLKSFEKLYVQDQIWKQICTHLRWEFIPSV